MRENFTTSPIVSSLASYVEPNKEKLIAKAVIGSRSRQYVSLQTGVKQKAQLNLLTNDIQFRSAASCGFSATSTQELSARIIECGNIAVNVEWCDKLLLGKWAEYQVKIAADKAAADLPFAEYFINTFVENIQFQADKAFWQGDKGNTAVANNLQYNDGALTILVDLHTATPTAVPGYSDESSAATKIAQVNKAIVKMDQAAKGHGQCRIYMSPEYYESYMLELVQANLYHYNPGEGASHYEYLVPGTNVIATSCPGLVGASYIIGANVDNIYWGCDLEGDQEVFDVWFSKDDRMFRADVEFNLGAQIAYPDQVSLIKIA